MPHVIVKLYSGRSDEQKRLISAEVTRVIMATANCAETAVSVGIEDVAKEDWDRLVRQPDIEAKPDTIFKQPGTMNSSK